MAYPVDEARIKDAEAQLGRRLPILLRARLRRNNGGGIQVDGETWWLFPIWDPSDKRHARKTANHILRETESALEWSGFPRDAIAIAGNGTGDLLVVRAESEEIEIWNHETGEAEPLDEITW